VLRSKLFWERLHIMTPHYLRFARALALVSGLAGFGGCADSHERDDAGRSDAAAPADAGLVCDDCECRFGADGGPGAPPECDIECCAVIGPLHPPDLPV
jgi:hypothetical protein